MRLLLLLFLTLAGCAVYAQKDVTVKGLITRQSGEPMQGVSILIKGTTKGTTTQADGSFLIEAPDNGTLVVSHTGYAKQEIKLNGTNHSNLTIQLAEGKNDLDE